MESQTREKRVTVKPGAECSPSSVLEEFLHSEECVDTGLVVRDAELLGQISSWGCRMNSGREVNTSITFVGKYNVSLQNLSEVNTLLNDIT